MANTVQLLTKTLKSSGYSLTKPRLLIFELLEGSDPISMARLVELTKDKIDRASAYRVVTLFEKIGIVHRINIGWKYKIELSDLFNHHHHHLACNDCGKITAIKEHQTIERAINDISVQAGYQPISHQLEIQGLCEDCQKS